jgi:DNA-binding NtrC family response regulator
MSKNTILIVEDEAIIAWDMKQVLAQRGYNIPPVAATAREAVDYARKYKPDVILMDIILKGEETGLDAFHQIRTKDAIPTIFITGNTHLLKDIESEGNMNFRVLSKPPQEHQLFQYINDILNI